MPDTVSADRIEKVRTAAERWRKDLVDTSGRNRLRNYRDLNTGTLDLTPGADNGLDIVALDQLLAGDTVLLSDLFPTFMDDTVAFNNARKHVSAIHRNARSDLEEKGIDTLFAAIGLATWKVEPDATSPNAPVLLAPLEIQPRGKKGSDFTIGISGDIILNPVLTHILEQDHGVDTTPVGQQIGDAQDTDKPLETFTPFERLADIADDWSGQRPELGLSIEPRMVAGIFRYASQAMVEDLKRNCERFAANDLIAAIAGDGDARAALGANIRDPAPNQPDRDPPAAEFLVLDADSSQHMAINRVLGGKSLIIHGPPGTGKSQTIANLIATLMACGKRVLFVAEKRAAIEAVYKRLEGVGLANLVMDIHGGIKGKKQFAKMLKDSLDMVGTVPPTDDDGLWGKIENRRETLIAYEHALHRERDPWGLSVFEIQQRLLAVPGEARTKLLLSLTAAEGINSAKFNSLASGIGEWVGLGGHTLATEHPEWSRSTIRTPDEAIEAYDLAHDLDGTHFPVARSALFAALDEVGLARTETVAEWRQALGFLAGVQQALRRCRADVFDLDHAALAEALAPVRGSRWRRLSAQLFSKDHRAARRAVRATLRESASLPAADALDLLETAGEQVAVWARRGGDGIPRVPDGLDVAITKVDALANNLGAFGKMMKIGDLARRPYAELGAMLERLASAESQAAAMKLPHVRQLEAGFREAEIDNVLGQVGQGIPAEHAADAVEHAWLQRVLNTIQFRDRRIGNFDGGTHSGIRDDFIEFDQQHIRATPQRVKRRVAEAATEAMNQYPGETAIVRAEANKGARFKPVRRLFEEAPHVLAALRPCWTMSPILVAERIPADLALFDVVIFDEASQIQPAEAIGSLARAPQAVIAGDDRQLPPTTFFGKVAADDDDDDDNGNSPNAAMSRSATEGMESILAVAKTITLREQMLQWHYRSRDDRLIAFSNRYLYRNALTGEALTAFPGTLNAVPILHHRVPKPSLTGSSNPEEVDAVINLVLEHAHECPDKTLGVIAFGQPHATAIEDALANLQGGDSALLATFEAEADKKGERLFVKNIERVQGDERDAIILSVGYSRRQANGKIAHNFGPINQDGGERRLNVAITRARERMTLVSTFDHHDMNPSPAWPQGVNLLHQYFEYVASGCENAGSPPPEMNPFELSIAEGLSELAIAKEMRQRGIKPFEAQYGVSGYRIDFACAHPDQPGRMVLAIEADGASYHSTPTARDRDRLRQQVLEDKGWRFHRIWSTAWFRDRQAELDKAEKAWLEAVAKADAGPPSPPPEPVAPPPADPPSEPSPARNGPRPVPQVGKHGYGNITHYHDHQLAELIDWIGSDGLLLTDEQLMAEMLRELGFKRRGKRIEDALARAIRRARR